MKLNGLQQRLPEGIKLVWWQRTWILVSVVVLLTVGVGLILWALDGSLLWTLIGVVLAMLVLIVEWILIPYRWGWFFYEVREREIEIEEGVIFRKRTLIPMIRIQHVEAEQGPLLRTKKLVSLSISTAATTHKIPAVRSVESDQLRYRILELVKAAKEDV